METGSILRWVFLIAAGALGPFGIVLLSAFLLVYLVSCDSYGTPLLAPFSPLIRGDLRDTFVKYGMESLSKRPEILRSENKTRLSTAQKNTQKDTQNGGEKNG